MKVEKTVELGNGHKIEFGKATWDVRATSLRNRYPTATGGFSPRSSSEIPIEDVKIILKESVKNGYMSNAELIEIAETCITALKFESADRKCLTQNDKLNFMKQASSDPLYLNDIKEVGDDFAALDYEI
ncbi:hypothetical protein EON73_03980 [bacterium]|nr:MAG: hypothetical protein EON73_03980 [bacterium]